MVQREAIRHSRVQRLLPKGEAMYPVSKGARRRAVRVRPNTMAVTEVALSAWRVLVAGHPLGQHPLELMAQPVPVQQEEREVLPHQEVVMVVGAAIIQAVPG